MLRMDDTVNFEIFKSFPPGRDAPVAELHVGYEHSVEIPMQVDRQQGELRVTSLDADGAIAWQLPLEALIVALRRAADTVA